MHIILTMIILTCRLILFCFAFLLKYANTVVSFSMLKFSITTYENILKQQK